MADEKIIFSMTGVGKIYPPSKQVLKNIYLSFFYGAKIGVLGLNGSGKSSLLRIIAGIDKEFLGEVVSDLSFSVGLLEQEPKLDKSKTVKEIVEEGVKDVVALLKEFEAINEKFADPDIMENPDAMEKLITKQGEIQEKLDAVNAWELDSKLDRAMDALRCPPPDAKIEYLSGGEKRRVALCRLLLQEPDVLLLDEPTNHLDAESVDWLEQHLKQYKGTVIAVTHDRHFLDNVAGWILELDRGEGIPWKGNYSSWLDQKGKRLAQEEKSESKRQKALERELEWVRMSPKGRQAKGKARLSAYEKLLSQETREKEDKLELFIPPGPRLGNKVIEASGVAKAYGDKLLYENLTFSLPPAGIVGIIGPNGAGKTTLFKMITGKEQADGGEIRIDGQDVRESLQHQLVALVDGTRVSPEEVEAADALPLPQHGNGVRPAVAGRLHPAAETRPPRLSVGHRGHVDGASLLHRLHAGAALRPGLVGLQVLGSVRGGGQDLEAVGGGHDQHAPGLRGDAGAGLSQSRRHDAQGIVPPHEQPGQAGQSGELRAAVHGYRPRSVGGWKRNARSRTREATSSRLISPA